MQAMSACPSETDLVRQTTIQGLQKGKKRRQVCKRDRDQ